MAAQSLRSRRSDGAWQVVHPSFGQSSIMALVSSPSFGGDVPLPSVRLPRRRLYAVLCRACGRGDERWGVASTRILQRFYPVGFLLLLGCNELTASCRVSTSRGSACKKLLVWHTSARHPSAAGGPGRDSASGLTVRARRRPAGARVSPRTHRQHTERALGHIHTEQALSLSVIKVHES